MPVILAPPIAVRTSYRGSIREMEARYPHEDSRRPVAVTVAVPQTHVPLASCSFRFTAGQSQGPLRHVMRAPPILYTRTMTVPNLPLPLGLGWAQEKADRRHHSHVPCMIDRGFLERWLDSHRLRVNIGVGDTGGYKR
jgi:hypothetical protein